MDIKRFISAGVLFPIIAIYLTFGNTVMIDILISIVSILCLHEFYNAFKDTRKPIKWLGYLVAVLIPFIHIVPSSYLALTIVSIIIGIVFILFLSIILTDMKYTIEDIMVSLFGIAYVVLFTSFLPCIRRLQNGVILLWLVIAAAWGSDACAYLVGVKLGKHKFSKISPKKSIEGCIGGAVGSIIISVIFVSLTNAFLATNFSLVSVGISAFVLSLIGQLGDFAASSIKRYNNIKDYSNLIPGHGGMLDRVDSVIFIAPFAYLLFRLLIGC